MKCVIVDIDGTIADCNWRAQKYLRDETGKDRHDKDWDSFFDSCDKDKPIRRICELVNLLSKEYYIVFCSGRRASSMKKTVEWINNNLNLSSIPGYLFRKNEDTRHDIYVKPELLNSLLNYNPELEIQFILEDRNSMVKKWRDLGYTCLQVAEGDF